MSEQRTTNVWRQTACNLCCVNRGVEEITEGHHIVKVRGDESHPDTKGDACQKAQRLDYYQNRADRPATPLRRCTDRTFESIAWEPAIDEIAERLNPAWRKEDPDGALRIHAEDLALGAIDDGRMMVEIRRGSVVTGIEADDSMRRGMVALPHGYGQHYLGQAGGVLVGPRINFLTASDDCDPITARPHHRNLAVHLRPAEPASAAVAEAHSLELLALLSA
jgi:anaerobic selenocysteine-containing dehydrogenase